MITNFNEYSSQIQKISSEVIRRMDSAGMTPFDALLKEAQKANATPNLIRGITQYLNNELMLSHYKLASKTKFNKLNVEEVLTALGVDTKSVKTASSNENYYDLTPYTGKSNVMEKVASLPEVKSESLEKLYAFRKEAKAIKEAQELYSKTETQVIKLAKDIMDEKAKLYQNVLKSIVHKENSPEEIVWLTKLSSDMDVNKTIVNALEDSRFPFDKNKYNQISKRAAELDINGNSDILKSMRVILEKKASIITLWSELDSATYSEERKAAMKKLFESHYGKFL